MTITRKSISRDLAVLGLVALSTGAQAQSFSWSTTFSPFPNINANSVSPGAQNAAPSTNDFFVTFTRQLPATTDNAPTNITFGTAVSNMLNNPDTTGDFGKGTFNQPFTMSLTIFDITQTYNLTLAGILDSKTTDSSTLDIFGLPVGPQVFNTNQGTFTVENFNSTGIGTPGRPPSGISANVFAQTVVTPELPGLLQFLPGLLPLALVGIRRRRNAQKAV